MTRLPDFYPSPVIGLLLVPRHRKRLLCIANSADTLAAMQETARGGDTDYRLSWHDPDTRGLTRHEIREHGRVTISTVDHRPKDREDRMAEIEARADAFVPMDEVEGMAA